MQKLSKLSVILLSALLFIASSKTFASADPLVGGKLRGIVTDTTNGEAIQYANIYIKNLRLGSPTDSKGYFFIPSIPPGKHVITVSCIGYKTKEILAEIKEGQITQLNIQLIPSSIRLEEVSVIGNKSARENEIDVGLQKISIKEIQMMPTGVEADIFKVLQSSPGVSSTGDVTSRYFVRGGNSNQNLVLLNGVTVYYPFHALGIYSTIDPEMISGMEFYKGGFGPEFGGRLSSVLNVLTRDGNKNSLHAAGTAGLLSGKASVEGPIHGGSFLVTGRKSYYAKALKKFLNDQEAPFDFYDMSFKVNYANPELLYNGKFTAHGFFSQDMVKNDDPFKEDYSIKNRLFGLNWYQIWASPLFSEITLSSSNFEAEVMPNLSQSKPRSNFVHDITSQWNFTYIYDSRDELNFGIENKFISTGLKMQNLYGKNISFDQSGYGLTGFANYKFYRYENIGFNLGMRVNFATISELRPFLLEPRINVTYKPIPTLSLKAGLGRYSQEMVTLSNENDLISIFEPWTIIQPNIAASEATQFTLGLSYFLTENFTVDLEGYYKYLTNLSEANYNKYFVTDPDYINVKGEAYGIESLIKVQTSGMYVKAGYSLSWSFKIDSKGVRYVPKYDLRHSLNILTGYDLGRGFELNATWFLNSGLPFSPITGFYDRLQIDNVWNVQDLTSFRGSTIWDRRNLERLTVYHRLDIGMSKKFNFGFAQFTLDASIMNVYNRKNIFYFDKNTGKQVNMLPFLPSVSLKVEL
ncbi:MAG TPA: TonB-dependent receptor [Ignavibacteriales bacterium]|nr:TonB-dependent receptor [Ignavibacteriales bacterium]